MKTQVETRRLRTWEADAGYVPQRAWRVIMKYGYLRMARTWFLATLGIGIVITEVLLLAGLSRSMVSATTAPDPGTILATVFFFLAVAVVALILVGAPLFADDLRFNAPLFYFSRPLRPDDYLRGKAMQMVSLLAALALLPTLALMVLGMLLGSTAGTPTDFAGNPLAGDALAAYNATHLTGFADWLYATAVVGAGVAVVLAFGIAVTLCASAYTRRGWHAGLAAFGFLGAWSVIGAMAKFGAKGAYESLFGPFGWIGLVLERPMTMRFHSSSPNPADAVPEGSGFAVAIAYGLLLATTLMLLGATVRRIRRVEAIL
ncbi:MAG: hypothetical protein V4510_09220 [bacterium]